MTREEAISLLQRGLVVYDEKGYLTALGYEALEAIDSSKCPTLVPKKNGEWIPCSDRVPKESGYYLVTTDGSHNNVIDIAEYGFDWRGDDFVMEWNKASKILAWMPLPEPYKGEGDEK